MRPMSARTSSAAWHLPSGDFAAKNPETASVVGFGPLLTTRLKINFAGGPGNRTPLGAAHTEVSLLDYLP